MKRQCQVLKIWKNGIDVIVQIGCYCLNSSQTLAVGLREDMIQELEAGGGFCANGCRVLLFCAMIRKIFVIVQNSYKYYQKGRPAQVRYDSYEKESYIRKEMVRMKKKRWIALLMAAVMLCISACSNAGQAGENAADTEIGSADRNGEKTSDTEADKAAGTETAAGETVTALSLMQEVNKTQIVPSVDNYRTWYEVFVYSFCDSNGDGIGDLAGLTEKLDYINDGDPATDTDLGCDGIWLMPIMPSTTYHKYDVTDYYEIDPEYGTLDDFEAFIAECHARGINVIIDLVMNHSSSQHTWFQTAADYLKNLSEGEEPDTEECPYVEYYNFSRESGSGYEQLSGTDWYYEARFWSEMPDLNLDNEAVRNEFEAIAAYWLDLGVDGFRLDAAKEFNTGDTAANVEVLSWFNEMVKEKKEDAYIVAEVWTDLTTYAAYYESGIDSCFNFAFADNSGTIANVAKGASSASAYGKALVNLQETLSAYSDNYIDAPFYVNHDMGRAAGHYAGDYSENQLKIAQSMNLLMTGSAFLYYGEELGMKGSGKDENKRAPMYWSKDASAEGMCDGPEDMENVKMKYDSLAEQQSDGNSIYNFVKETIKVRNSYPEIMRGTVTFEESLSGKEICTIRKSYDGSEVMLVFNISGNTQPLDLSQTSVNGGEAGAAQIDGVLLTGSEPVTFADGQLTLPAYSVVVLQ